ncbi:MAG TPA: surface-adhesin E family protein [Allosphingosinicella sp.]|nr:surface-adhesin E family protein [Allosphingosinicella sp.]
MKSWIFALAAIAAWGPAALAQAGAPTEGAYRPLGVDDLGIEFIDEASIVKDGTNREFSLLVVFAHPEADDSGAEFPYATFRSRVDCAAGTEKGLFAIFHAKDGTDQRVVGHQPAAALQPGSPMADAADYACSGKRAAAAAEARPMSETEAVRVAMGAFAVSAPAGAAPGPVYRLLGANDEDAEFLDQGSIAKDGTSRDYVLLVVWAKPKLGNDGRTEHPYARYQARIDCAAWTASLLSVTIYRKDGPEKPIILGRAPERLDRGSVAEIGADYLCKGKVDPQIAGTPLVTVEEAVRAANMLFAKGKDRRRAGGK